MTSKTTASVDARMAELRHAAGLSGMPVEHHGGVAVHRTGNGPSLVLLHGGRGSWNHWIRNIPELARQYSLFVVDLPGFGESAPVTRDLDYDEYLLILAKAVGGVTGGERFDLAGFSFGGLCAALLTARHLGAQVERLSLLAPAGWGNDSAGGRENRRGLRGVTDEAERRAVFRHNLLANQIADPAKVTDETVDLLAYNIAHTVFHSPGAGSLPLLLDGLRAVRAPLQVMLGECDVLQQPSREWRADRMAEAAPHAMIQTLPGAGHWAQYETPEEYNRRLLDFLRR
jgi:2-hydroxy-6-oxonona-2,4-dienedioate hydrolase